MANDLNRCEFIGRLGKNVEVRYTADGKAISSFSLACGESWKNKSTGQKQEKTTWVPVVLFGGLADIAAKYLTKGSLVYVSGKFTTRKWQDQSGADKYTTEVVVDGFSGQMQMLGGNQQQSNQTQQQNNNQGGQQYQQNNNQQNNNQNQNNQYQKQNNSNNNQNNNDIDDKDIPF